MKLLRRWRAFWQSIPARVFGSYVDNSHDGITRLRADAPTVTAQEIAEFKKRPRTNPLDYDVDPPPA